MDRLLTLWDTFTDSLNQAGQWVSVLSLRLILGYEFYDSGVTKLRGENWFGSIQDQFIFPFNVISADFSWFLATWFEILGGLALVVGLATRFFSFSLIILTIVAALAVHWPEQWDTLAELWKGYAITDQGFGNYKLPLLFVVMLIPLVFSGPGKLSLDHLIRKFLGRS